MINRQWLELPMFRTNYHGPEDVRAIEVRLYFELWDCKDAHWSVAYSIVNLIIQLYKQNGPSSNF